MNTMTVSFAVNTLVETVTREGGRVYEVRNPNRRNEFGVQFPPSWDDQRRADFLRSVSAAHGLRYFESHIAR